MGTKFGYQSKMLVLIAVLLIILSPPFLEIFFEIFLKFSLNFSRKLSLKFFVFHTRRGSFYWAPIANFRDKKGTHVEDTTGISKTMYRLRAPGWSTLCTNRDAPISKTGIAPSLPSNSDSDDARFSGALYPKAISARCIQNVSYSIENPHCEK